MKRISEATDEQKMYLGKLGIKIESCMKNLHKSNAIMLQRVGCSEPHIIDIKKGRTIANVLEIVSICDVLAITPNELLDVDNSNRYDDQKFSKNKKIDADLMHAMLEKMEHLDDSQKNRFLSYIDRFQ